MGFGKKTSCVRFWWIGFRPISGRPRGAASRVFRGIDPPQGFLFMVSARFGRRRRSGLKNNGGAISARASPRRRWV